MKIRFCVGALLLAGCTSGYEGPSMSYVQGERLWKMCMEKAGMCDAYVFGVIDAKELAYSSEHGGKRWLCKPPADINDLPKAVVRYMQANPTMLVGSGADIVASALEPAFGCP